MRSPSSASSPRSRRSPHPHPRPRLRPRRPPRPPSQASDMLRRVLVGIGAGLVVGVLIVQLAGLARGEVHTRTRLVAEDASAPLRRIAIHYAPASDPRALGIWQQL